MICSLLSEHQQNVIRNTALFLFLSVNFQRLDLLLLTRTCTYIRVWPQGSNSVRSYITLDPPARTNESHQTFLRNSLRKPFAVEFLTRHEISVPCLDFRIPVAEQHRRRSGRRVESTADEYDCSLAAAVRGRERRRLVAIPPGGECTSCRPLLALVPDDGEFFRKP